MQESSKFTKATNCETSNRMLYTSGPVSKQVSK